MNDSLYFDLLNENLFNIYDGEISFNNINENTSSRGNITFQLSPYPDILINGKEPRSRCLVGNAIIRSFHSKCNKGSIRSWRTQRSLYNKKQME